MEFHKVGPYLLIASSLDSRLHFPYIQHARTTHDGRRLTCHFRYAPPSVSLTPRRTRCWGKVVPKRPPMPEHPNERVMTSTPRPIKALAKACNWTDLLVVMNFAPDVNLRYGVAPAPPQSLMTTSTSPSLPYSGMAGVQFLLRNRWRQIFDDARPHGQHPNHTFVRELGVGLLPSYLVFAVATTVPQHEFRMVGVNSELQSYRIQNGGSEYFLLARIQNCSPRVCLLQSPRLPLRMMDVNGDMECPPVDSRFQV